MISLLLGATVGLILGSLIKCLADRSTTKESFFTRSHCDRCKHPLNWLDLIPIVSFAISRGKCRYCHKRLSNMLPIYEAISSILFAVLFYNFLPETVFLAPSILSIAPILDLVLKSFAITVFLICLITDVQTGLIPNRITYAAAIIVIVYQIASSIAKVGVLYYSLTTTVLGKYLLPPHSDYFYRHAVEILFPLIDNLAAAICLGLFFLLLIVVTKGKGMGGGDLKLSIFIGLCLGLLPSLAAMMIAFILGSIFGIAMILIGKKSFGQTIPFGPFLSIGSILVILWGPQIITWYLHLGR